MVTSSHLSVIIGTTLATWKLIEATSSKLLTLAGYNVGQRCEKPPLTLGLIPSSAR